jgi:hypothetical protein
MDGPSANISEEALQQSKPQGRRLKHEPYETRNVQNGSNWKSSIDRSRT